ncbi:metalloendopeptidase [Saccharomycopsis crataegensis]|uniref:Metalloendopeptidase n=1 Tax=Saccharomycopsis crataegensis TaxID=43959 RepID=A0AAV5QU52_9ASCO|nr:metalloendopeptidase [Saccharomycopsis crataegensis]
MQIIFYNNIRKSSCFRMLPRLLSGSRRTIRPSHVRITTSGASRIFKGDKLYITCHSPKSYLNTPYHCQSKHYSTYKTFKNVSVTSNPIEYFASPGSRNKILLVLALVGVVYVSNLDEAPISHRSRFLWIPKWVEQYLGNRTYNQIMSQYRGQFLSRAHPTHQNVEYVVGKLLKSSDELIKANDNNITDGSFSRDTDTDEIRWEVHVINSSRDPPNAFVIPGGKIFVFSSILPYTQNNDGLATVLSHEISHELARHTGEKLSREPLSIVVSLASLVIFGTDILGKLSGLVSLHHSRTQESEADYMGLMIMANACFHPEEAIKFWKRMSGMGSMKPPEYLSTHPSDGTRINNIESWLPEANARRGYAGCDDVTAFFSKSW